MFYSILADPSDSDEDMGHLIVVSGSIEWYGKTYEEIRDMEEAGREHCISPEDLKLYSTSSTVSLTIREKVECLEVAFVVPVTSRSGGPGCLLPPGEIVERALSKLPRVSCVRNGGFGQCEPWPLRNAKLLRHEQPFYEQLELHGSVTDVYKCPQSMRWMLLAYKSSATPPWAADRVFLAHRECLNCCLRAVHKRFQNSERLDGQEKFLLIMPETENLSTETPNGFITSEGNTPKLRIESSHK